MTTIKHNGIFKRFGALVMALGLTCALAIGASAASNSYSVTINKAGSDDISMANDIVAGDATVTTVADGVQIDILIKPIEDYTAMPFLPAADGYLQTVEIPEAVSAEVVKDGVMYEEATLSIVMNEMPTDGVIEVESSTIQLYTANTSDRYPIMSHITPAFDIVLE